MCSFMGLPWWLRSWRILLPMQRPGFHPWVGKIPLEEGKAAHSRILAWRIPCAEVPGGATVQRITKSRTRLRDWTTTCVHLYITWFRKSKCQGDDDGLPLEGDLRDLQATRMHSEVMWPLWWDGMGVRAGSFLRMHMSISHTKCGQEWLLWWSSH